MVYQTPVNIYKIHCVIFQKRESPPETQYLLTPRCRVLLEKLTGLQLVKKFTAFHGTRMFITALTSVRHLSLSWASPIQSIYPHPTSWRSILISSTHLGLDLPSGLLPSDFPTKTLYTTSHHSYAPHHQPISFFSILSPAQYWVGRTNHLAPRYAISSIPRYLVPHMSKYSLQHHVLKHLLLCVHWKTPDDGQRNCPKHVEFYSKNKFDKLVHLVGFIIRIYHDAGSGDLQL